MTTQTAVPIESAADYSLRRNLRAVSMVFESPTTFKFRHNNVESAPHVPSNLKLNEERDTASQSMSLAFREVFQSYKDGENHPVSVHETKPGQLADSFSRGEQLLRSEDNVRPSSRSKTSANIRELNVNGANNDQLLKRMSPKSAKSFHSQIVDKRVNEIFANVRSPVSTEEHKNGSNNAEEVLEKSIKSKKGKKHRKRSNSISVKIKRGKHGRVAVPVNGAHDRHERDSVTPSAFNNSNKHSSTRVSSGPTSKISLSSILSYTLTGNAQKRILATSAKHRSDTTVPPLNLYSDNSKALSTKSDNVTTTNKAQSVSSVTTVHSTLVNNPFNAQGTPVTLFKTESLPRVKSGHSVKSESRSLCSAAAKDDTRERNAPVLPSEELTLTAKPCQMQNLQQTRKPPSQSYTHSNHHKSSSFKNSSVDPSCKEALLTSIYGTVYQTADKLQTQVDELKKARKIFLSDKQSGNIRENGVDYPCAPPATPNPDLLSKYEYVPSMGDIRSQQAVKKRLQVMEREATKKKEKQKEERVKNEKQQIKDREKALKTKQRREIYALNKIMTDLEYKRFLEFCQAKGLKM